jgi:SPP1 family predicted phage head-tail adaptor
MAIPKRFSTGVQYLGASAFNTRVTFIQPNTGQAADGTPNTPVVVKHTHANVAQWRGKETDKEQNRVGVSSYKLIIRYPKGYSIDGGMNIMVRGQLHEIESFSDPDGQRIELHIWTFVTSDIAGCN